MANLGFPKIPLVIKETGSPTQDGDGAVLEIASDYIHQELLRSTLSLQVASSHPGAFMTTYIFTLFNEDQKDGTPVEKNWGLLYPDGSLVYSVNCTLFIAGSITDEPPSSSLPSARHAPHPHH
ncbi:hypothetical protein L7F22_040997 [Adiantum nelumboides]|nr:hypothetical protein [Adiantum nelumboides]